MESVFSIEEALSFGWKKTREHSMLLFQVVLTMFAVQVVYAIVGRVLQNTLLGVAASLVLVVISVIISVGFVRISLKIARGEAAIYKDLVPPVKLVWQVFLGSLLTGILVCLGILLLIVPGIYLALRFSMVRFAILDGSEVFESLKKSTDLTDGFKWKLLGFFIVFGILNVIGALLFMVGLLLTVPVTMVAYAHVYQKLLHHAPRKVAAAHDHDDSHEGHDHAGHTHE